jgi:hypothetical protein
VCISVADKGIFIMADNYQQISKQQNNTEVPATAAMRQQGAEAVRQGAQAMQQGVHATSEAVRRAGDVTAEAAQRGGQAGAEAVQRAGDAASETMRRSAEAFTASQRQLVQKAAQQSEEMGRKVAQAAQGITEDLRAFMTLPNAANGGLQDLRQSVTGLIEGVVRTNLRATQELLQLANPSAFVELQQRFMREYLDVLMQGTATLVRATRRTADETLRPLEQQIAQRQQANQSQRYQYAAE